MLHEALERWANPQETRPLRELAEEAARERGWPGLAGPDAKQADRFATFFNNSATMRLAPESWSASRAQRKWNIHLLPHSSPNSSSSAERNARVESAGWIEGSGNFTSSFSRMGVESCMPSSSGVATAGMIGSFAYFLYSSMLELLRTIHSWGIPL